MNNASTSLTIIYTLVSIALVAGGFFSGTVTYFFRRRVTPGKISTSDADVLWQQSEAMRNTLQKEKELAENQRDKMIQVNGQILPMLENINSSLVKIGEALEKGEG